MKNQQERKELKLYVLSAKDIQDIKNISYTRALYILKQFNYFYINSRPYILASDFFDEKYNVKEISFLSKIENDNKTKLIKVLPLMLTVQDIQQVFQCGSRQAYEIMDIIPGVFKINSKRYVREIDFNNWLETLPNSKLKIA